MQDETRRLIDLAQDELEKAAWVARARRELISRGLLTPKKEPTYVKVRIDMEVQLMAGHPAQLLAVLREHLGGLTVEDIQDGVVACVKHVDRVEVG